MISNSICLAMLCGSGSVKHDTTNSLIMTIQDLIAKGIAYEYVTVQGVTGVDSARNIITDLFLAGDCEFMLMIDDDMAWAADLPARMMKERLGILGVLYLRKNKTNPRWTVNHDPVNVDVMQGREYLMRVDSIATGMMMIHRDVFAAQFSCTRTAIISENKPPIPLYFRHTIDADGRLKSEDYSFCERARKAGIDIWAWIDEPIAHIGNYAYTGNYRNVINGAAFDGKREPLKVMLE